MPPNILVVEDDYLLQQVVLDEISHVCDSSEVCFVGNGHDAVTYFDQYRHNLDLVIFDPKVPWIHGPAPFECSFLAHMMRPCNRFNGLLFLLLNDQNRELFYIGVSTETLPDSIRHCIEQKSPV